MTRELAPQVIEFASEKCQGRHTWQPPQHRGPAPHFPGDEAIRGESRYCLIISGPRWGEAAKCAQSCPCSALLPHAGTRFCPEGCRTLGCPMGAAGACWWHHWEAPW